MSELEPENVEPEKEGITSTVGDLDELAAALPEEPSEPEKETSDFKLESLDDLRRIIVMARGGDPDAQQTLNAFLKFNNNIERTNLPIRRDVQMIAYLDYAGKTLYAGNEDNPFTKAANCISIAFMAKGGDKSKQFVELMKQTPSLADLQVAGVHQRSLTDRILGRGKTE